MIEFLSFNEQQIKKAFNKEKKATIKSISKLNTPAIYAQSIRAYMRNDENKKRLFQIYAEFLDDLADGLVKKGYKISKPKTKVLDNYEEGFISILPIIEIEKGEKL